MLKVDFFITIFLVIYTEFSFLFPEILTRTNGDSLAKFSGELLHEHPILKVN